MATSPDPQPLGAVEGSDGIFVIRGGGNTRGWNGIQYKAGLSARTCRRGSCR